MQLSLLALLPLISATVGNRDIVLMAADFGRRYANGSRLWTPHSFWS